MRNLAVALGIAQVALATGATITCPTLEVDSLYFDAFAPVGYGGWSTTISGGAQIVTPASGVLAWASVLQECSGSTGPTTIYLDSSILTNKWHARLKYNPSGNETPSGSYLIGFRFSDNTSEYALTYPSIATLTWFGYQYAGRITRPNNSSSDLGVASYSGGRDYFDGPPYGATGASNGGAVGTKWVFSKVRFALDNGDWIGHAYLFTTVFAQGRGLFSEALFGNPHGVSRDEQVEVYSIANTAVDMLRGSFDPNGGNNANPGGEQVVVDFRTPNTTTVVYQAVLEVEPDGGDFKYEIPTPDTPGDYDLSFQYDHCLRRTVTVDTTDLETQVNLELINGDINLDNAIDIGDYAALSFYYEVDDSDEEVWLTPDPESLLAPVDCDLNGDGVVDIGDYSIISENMEEVGDE